MPGAFLFLLAIVIGTTGTLISYCIWGGRGARACLMLSGAILGGLALIQVAAALSVLLRH